MKIEAIQSGYESAVWENKPLELNMKRIISFKLLRSKPIVLLYRFKSKEGSKQERNKISNQNVPCSLFNSFNNSTTLIQKSVCM